MPSGANGNDHQAWLQAPFRALVERANAAVFVVQGSEYLYVNPAMQRMSGRSEDELCGRDFWEVIHPDEQGMVRERCRARLQGVDVPDNYLVRLVHKDGSIRQTSFTASLIEAKGRPAVLGVLQDITELESRRLQIEHQLRQAQKMEAIGTLVGGIAHDFNNLLAGITGSAYLARMYAGDEKKTLGKLETIDRLCFRGAGMIRHLLAFARKDMVHMQPVDVGPLVAETMAMKRMEIPRHVEFAVDVEAIGGMQVLGDAAQLQEMLLIMVNNACDALHEVDEPQVRLAVTPFEADDVFLREHAHLGGREFVHISVIDNGCGMSEPTMERIFEPFFTTKGVGSGSGLGLSMLYGAVHMHGGTLDVESTPGTGSRFHVFLPRHVGANGVRAPRDSKALAPGRGECILFVDDDPGVLNIGCEVLGSLGYRVLAAADGRSAVEIFRQHADEIDLAVIDVVMPLQDGWQTAEEILALRPSVRLMFVTGYDMAEDVAGMDHVAAGDVLLKPYSVEALSQAIRRKLDG